MITVPKSSGTRPTLSVWTFPDSLHCCPFRFSVAESDCNLAIALDSNYFKAFARRGAARFALEKYDSAMEGETLHSHRGGGSMVDPSVAVGR